MAAMTALTNNPRYVLWDPAVPLPRPGKVPDLRCVTHSVVHRAVPGEYQFLHESAVTVHDGKLVAAWANDPRDENSAEGIVRAAWSSNRGKTWERLQVVGPGAVSAAGQECDNHVVLHSHGGRLYAYASRWLGGPQEDHGWHPLPSMRGVQFLYRKETDDWVETGVTIPRFLHMQGPQKLPDGGWIMAGEFGFSEPAVAICEDDDFTVWKTYPITTRRKLRFPEPTVIVEPNRLVAVIRHFNMMGPPRETGLVSESFDGGRTWSEAVESNLPMVDSKPFGGILSTGQRYLVFNYPDPHSRRGNLVIGVSRPGEDRLSALATIRQGIPPVQLVGECKEPQWSYPYAVELEGTLYVTYSISKEDCAMSAIPIDVLG
jgi:hypothetical protein